MKTNVKNRRTATKMTQQQLADAVHVSSRTTISIEKEQYSPSLMLAYRIADIEAKMKILKIILGILLIIMGGYCIIQSGVTFLGIGWMLGPLLIIIGLQSIIFYIQERKAKKSFRCYRGRTLPDCGNIFIYTSGSSSSDDRISDRILRNKRWNQLHNFSVYER